MALVGAFSIEWGIGALMDLPSTSGLQPRKALRATFTTLLARQLASFVRFAMAARWRAKRALGRSALVRGGFASISGTKPR